MKIETTAKPRFQPVTLKLETAEELQLLTALFGGAPGSISDLYNLHPDFMYDTYKGLKDASEAQGVTYAGHVQVTKK